MALLLLPPVPFAAALVQPAAPSAAAQAPARPAMLPDRHPAARSTAPAARPCPAQICGHNSFENPALNGRPAARSTVPSARTPGPPCPAHVPGQICGHRPGPAGPAAIVVYQAGKDTTVFQQGNQIYRIPTSAGSGGVTKPPAPPDMVTYLNSKLFRANRFYGGNLVNGSGSGQIFLKPREGNGPVPDLIGVTYTNGVPVQLIRVEVYAPLYTTPVSKASADAETELRKAEDLVIQIDPGPQNLTLTSPQQRTEYRLIEKIAPALVYPDGRRATVCRLGTVGLVPGRPLRDACSMMLSPQVRDRILVQRSGEIIRRRAACPEPGAPPWPSASGPPRLSRRTG